MYPLKPQPDKAENVKKPWTKPGIVLERSLEVKAQGSGPDSPLGPFGPLTT